ncbi:MAG: TraM recognition domain-containing protein [Victivallales bacterium]
MTRITIFALLITSAFAVAGFSLFLSAILVVSGAFVFFHRCKREEPGHSKGAQIVASLGKFTWDMNDFCRGWSITGRTGSGKTVAAIKTLMHQVFRNCPNWGGIAVDEKGSFHEIVSEIAGKYGAEDRIVCFQVRPDDASPDWEPKAKFNLLSYPGIPWSTYAKIVVDTASSLGQSGDKGFFRTQAQIHIEKAMELLEILQYPVTLENVYDMLTDKKNLADAVGSLAEDLDGKMMDFVEQHPELRIKLMLMKHFGDKFLNQPPDQLGGVISTIFNYLQYFTNPDIAEIFCCDEGSIDFSELDSGKIFVASMPQKYQVERRYVNTFMKLLFYVHCLRRFDMSQEYRRNANLLIFWADEAQGIVTAADDGFADYKVIDKIREARGTVIFAAQSTTSYYPVLDEKKTEVLLLNLSNQIYFTLADPKAAKLAADIIGKREYWKRSYGYSGGRGNSSYQKVEEYKIKEHELMAMKKFECVIKHCEKGFVKTVITPVF